MDASIEPLLGQQTAVPLINPELLEKTDKTQGNLFESKDTKKPIQAHYNHDHYHLVNDEDSLKRLVSKLEKQTVFAIDTETNSLNPISADLVGISICYDELSAYYLPLKGIGANTLPKQMVLKYLGPILEDKNIKKVGIKRTTY